MKTGLRYLLTAGVLLLAAALVLFEYRDYIVNPWTRDGQVRADVVQIAPRVTGPIVSLEVEDNQFLRAGEVLFRIDPRTFQVAVNQARAQYDEARDAYQSLVRQVEAASAQVEVARATVSQAESAIKELDAQVQKSRAELNRQRELLPKRATSQRSLEQAVASFDVATEQREAALASLLPARASAARSEADLQRARADLGALGEDNARLRAARAALEEAELNLEFTTVRAPVDGYVTNLGLRIGSHAVANQPVLALVDVNSYWVYGFFRETLVGDFRPGDAAVVTLMTYPDSPLAGTVESIGWGIAQEDGSTSHEMLPKISPTFEWIRLAQRIPVRVKLDPLPEGIELRVGTTASVLVRTSGDAN